MFVIVDDYSRFTWIIFLATKEEIFLMFITFIKKLQRKMNTHATSIRYDHGTEFENVNFLEFCVNNNIDYNFLTPRTPQQNGVVERKYRTLEDMARTIFIASSLPKFIWVEVANTACYIINRYIIRTIIKKTPYELLRAENLIYSPKRFW